ncbi:MAG: pantoate--beta-alanine ligase [Tatlockia sp.]|nr:pantoate--beta-alanine ligase [Tatlockia sp.]
MKVFENLDEWLSYRNSLPANLSLGFAPTMGNLHAGHASLFAQSKKENDCTVASIFINPTQFNRVEDLSSYPRSLSSDINLLEKAGVDYCLLPTEQAIYADAYRFKLQESVLCQLLEGKHRPGHFNGVLTVVMKLLNLVRPKTAYFGEKDYQQYLLIRDMAAAFFMGINIKACPTVREESGLAYSSRNNRLNAEQRLKAEQFASLFHQKKCAELLLDELKNKGFEVEYLEEYEGRRFAAIIIGDIRLIDNYAL